LKAALSDRGGERVRVVAANSAQIFAPRGVNAMSIRRVVFVATAFLTPICLCRPASAQRALGLDVSTYQGEISQTQWDNLLSVDNHQFVFIRSSRGGTTGEDHRQGGYPAGDTFFDLAERYDDPYFVQNITRATTAGLFAGAYHFARLDVIASTPNTGGIANSGTDEATHFVQMAGAWMRPGYLMPTYDLESGQGARTNDQIAQFSIDFSNQLYALTGVRPAMYINGNYSSVLQGASSTLRAQIAQPTGAQPSVVSPGFPMLWNARYATNPDIQNDHPRNTSTLFYGPFDDYGEFQPWDFWQYTSSGSLQGIAPVDQNVSHGDIEYVKDFLVPAVWMNDSSGDWSTMANWNSGQAPVAPITSPGQLTPFGSYPLPTPRAAGVAGPSITDGQNDTVILERPNADITVTLSAGDYNVRKLYVREALNLTGGSLTVNYDPDYAVPVDAFGNPLYPNALRSGYYAATFSAPVTLSGAGQLHVNSLLIDTGQTFTVAGGSLSFRTIEFNYGFPTPSKILLQSNLDVNPAAVGGTSYIGYNGVVDLDGVDRAINVAAGGELSIAATIGNGALTKTGPGTLRLNGFNQYAGATTVNAGTLLVSYTTGTGDVAVNGPTGRLAGTGYVQAALTVNSGGTLAPGDAYGPLYVSANTAFNAGSTFEYQFDPSNFFYDTLNVAGNLSVVGSPTLHLDTPLNSLLPRHTRYTLVSYAGDWDGGAFDGYANNSVFQLGGNYFQIQYDDLAAFNAQNGGSVYFSKGVTLTSLSGPVAGFVDEYAPQNWTLDDANAHGGSVYTGNAPYSIYLYGPEDRSRLPGEIAWSIAVVGTGTLSFDWNFYNADLPGYDLAYFLNGVQVDLLANADGAFGHVDLQVDVGDIVGWRITSTDSVGGQATLYLSNFIAPAPPFVVPEPGAIGAAGSLALLALARRRRVASSQ
jgi:autotransporter-associated beta strand protein